MNELMVKEECVINEALAIIETRFKDDKRESLCSSKSAIQYASLKLATRKSEVFAAMLLDSQNRVLKYIEYFFGTIDGCVVYPREIVRTCMEYNAAGIILCHNHPSGFLQPSDSDKRITKVIVDVLQHVDVKVVDHIIVAGAKHYSFQENGIMPHETLVL